MKQSLKTKFHTKRASMQKTIAGLFCGVFAMFALSLFTPQSALAASMVVDPLIIDHQGLPRDIIKGSFKITNPNHYKTTVFTTTKNVDPSKGNQKPVDLGEADLSSSFANWISGASLMIELEPGETKTIPYEININMRANEGTYHAIMYFPQGVSRSEAELQIDSAAKIAVNLVVGDDSKDRLQVGKFTGPKIVLGSTGNFEAIVNNTGNTTLKPTGELRIFNRNSQEVATIQVNEDGTEVLPEEQKVFNVDWQKARGFGRYKAQLVMEFGDKQFQTYQDSVYFWLLPWPLLLFVIMILSGVGLLLVYTLHKAHFKRLKAQEQYYEDLIKHRVRQAKTQAKAKAQKNNTLPK